MPLFLVMLYFPSPMSTRAHSDSTGVPLMPVSVSWQHTAIHPGTGEHLLRSYTHIWQQAVPMSPSKQATKAHRRKQRTAFPWKQRQAEAPIPAVLGCHLALAAFPSHSFLPSLWQGQVARGHLPAPAILPELTAFYSPAGRGGSWKHCGLSPSSLPSGLISSVLCTTLCVTAGVTLPAPEPWHLLLQ